MYKRVSIKILALFILCFPVELSAQMFSVDDKEESFTSPFNPYIRAGINVIDFNYAGNKNAIPVDERYDFDGFGAIVGFESSGLNVHLAYATDITGLENRNYLQINADLTTPFIIIRQPRFNAGIPVKLGTKFTNVVNTNFDEEFSQTNVSIGGGVVTNFYQPNRIFISFQLIPSYGFSSASGGFIGGNAFSLDGKIRLNFMYFIFGKNLSLGYDYHYDSYDVEGNQFDYNLTGHSLTLGISL